MKQSLLSWGGKWACAGLCAGVLSVSAVGQEIAILDGESGHNFEYEDPIKTLGWNAKHFACSEEGLTRFANSSSVGVPTYSNNYYYNCENLISQAEGNTQSGLTCFDTEGTILEENPFADPDNGDFTITDELLRSYQFGDPRWY